MFRIVGAVLAALWAAAFGGCAYRGDNSFAAPAAADSVQTEETEETAAVPEVLSGAWFNAENMEEKWVFGEGGVLTIGENTHTYSLKWSLFSGELLKIDDKYYGFRVYDNSCIYIYDRATGAPVFTLYSGESEYYRTRIKELVRKERLETECAELFGRYPDKCGWINKAGCGDIPFLADANFIDECVGEGIFRVKTPEQLASFCWYVNTQPNVPQYMLLEADIDLAGYEWAPMGWAEGDMPFSGYVDGGGHTIKNMTIELDSGGSCAGFIGWETWCAVQNIRFEGAKVSGGYAGVVTGQAIGGSYYNIMIENSEVSGSTAGSMLGWDANTTKKDCSADVVVNGESFDFLSYNESEKSKIVIENPVEITIDENHTVTRPEVEGYTNLGWMVFYNGEQVLHRNAQNELSYTYFLNEPGTYEIYLTAFVSGQYVPISNTVSYTIS